MSYAYWRHMLSGECFAVELDSELAPIRVCGPLDFRTYLIDPNEQSAYAIDRLADYNYSTEDVDWIREHMDTFEVVAGLGP